jgi:lipoyl(octanoyl) transferase
MAEQKIVFEDLGFLSYQDAWDYQEKLLAQNVRIKTEQRKKETGNVNDEASTTTDTDTTSYLLFVEHPPVYTLGKSGNIQNVLLTEDQLHEKHILFYHTNRGGDITFHGPGQLVGYPILDLEKFDTDIGKYLRRIEETIILTLAEYGIKGERSPGETGVWIDPVNPLRARKICAIGVRCSRWITMHGFALNVNTDLDYFNYIIPCGISNKQVTSLQKELGAEIKLAEVKDKVMKNFERVFNVELHRLTANS